jgi:hypothetical protein
MRSWDAFVGLEVTVKNMLTSLRAVGELQVSISPNFYGCNLLIFVIS